MLFVYCHEMTQTFRNWKLGTDVGGVKLPSGWQVEVGSPGRAAKQLMSYGNLCTVNTVYMPFSKLWIWIRNGETWCFTPEHGLQKVGHLQNLQQIYTNSNCIIISRLSNKGWRFNSTQHCVRGLEPCSLLNIHKMACSTMIHLLTFDAEKSVSP